MPEHLSNSSHCSCRQPHLMEKKTPSSAPAWPLSVPARLGAPTLPLLHGERQTLCTEEATKFCHCSGPWACLGTLGAPYGCHSKEEATARRKAELRESCRWACLHLSDSLPLPHGRRTPSSALAQAAELGLPMPVPSHCQPAPPLVTLSQSGKLYRGRLLYSFLAQATEPFL